jgi:putative redox protein
MMDAVEGLGGNDGATRPMELLLMSLGGCTGMDVLSILVKMKQSVEDFHIELEGEHAPEHPKIYTKIEMVYVVAGNVDAAKLERAIELSEEKYCSISAMLRAAGVNIQTSYRIEAADFIPESDQG